MYERDCRSKRNASDNQEGGVLKDAQNISAEEASASEGARLQEENEDRRRQKRIKEKTR